LNLFVIQMHGEPGSGKSTLAKALGPRAGAIVLDKDLVKSALLRAGVQEVTAGPASYEAFHAVAASLLAQGYSLILDNPIYWKIAQERSLQRALEGGAAYVFIECVCPDATELARRLASRDAMPSQPRERLKLEAYPGAIEAMHQPRLTLDTRRPIDELVAESLRYIDAAVGRIAGPQPEPSSSSKVARASGSS
jgi:predicted kinase